MTIAEKYSGESWGSGRWPFWTSSVNDHQRARRSRPYFTDCELTMEHIDLRLLLGTYHLMINFQIIYRRDYYFNKINKT
jgi:hypothetical protein